jgi:hypothetical protein
MATAKSSPADITEIQRRMAQIRRDLHEDVREAVKGAQSLTDWRSRVRSHPWLALGAATVVGYLIVPKRHPAPAIVAVAPAPAQAAVSTPEAPRRKRWGLIGSAVGLVAPIAVRAAQNYAIQYLEQWIASKPAGGGASPFVAGLFPGGPTVEGGPATGARPSSPSHPPGRPRDVR